MIKNLLITYLFLITNVFAGFPPTTMRGQSQTLKPTTFNFQVPNKQATITAASTSLIETGNNNELENRGFEHTTVTTGWTISNATSSSSTTRIEGSKSLSLALTGALSLSQSSTINAAQKSGVQMVASIWVNSSDVSDLQLCSLKNGSEDKCTVTGGYVQGSGWRQLTVSFLGDSTSNGLKLKSTDTTGTVLVDQAYVGIGSPVVDFTPDMVYSAKISATGVVSDENTDWIDGNCTNPAAGVYTCTFKTGVFSITPNCVATAEDRNNIAGTSYSSGTVSVGLASRTSGAINGVSTLSCQKQGADYKTSKAYVASGSLALNTTEYSALISSTGTVSTSNVSGWTTGATFAGGEWTINFGSGYFPSVAPACVVTPSRNGSDAGVRIYNETTTSAKIAIYIAGAATQSAFHIVCQKQGADYQAAFNPVIVGSFQGYNETPGTRRPVVSSVQVAAGTKSTVCTTGSCTLYANRGGFVSAASWSSAGVYNITLNPAVSSISETNCVVSPISTSGGIRTCKFESPIDSTSEVVKCTDNGNNPENNLFTIMCHGSL